MNYKQAVDKIKEHESLIEMEIKGRTISELVIVPSDRQHDRNIIDRVYWDKPFDDLLLGHTDFEIIVLFDLHTVYRATGLLVTENLENVLRQIHEQKNGH